jgi:hypothetical protein
MTTHNEALYNSGKIKKFVKAELELDIRLVLLYMKTRTNIR